MRGRSSFKELSDDSGYFTGGAESRGGHLDKDINDIPQQQNNLIVAAMCGHEAKIQLLLGRQDVIPDFKCRGYTFCC
jgi:hypothetical protein